mmetsp:Transcript_8650/g.36057  ORF Transcript_8650/g.36057 Transcript_8650/m.36057 type:complete len:156 (-) Transcript_8650:162-629(-)|eukprot:CAMPEP_0114635796 /NCGR_PEP_ID=MMETSP0168-20121206/16662_1 /TAXON_ID=95228 ORGANISM="Vannella sp., Strain DIVA3 517/6/12" /NCGR_SAMPLE_ID=MMETSP0168 /ASSEMBLY_ACC=CAM_ASM_000044 /LENGTH=155 /DNA_ID=CAMNT_0001847503 /DNA_START=28 /DNA_END=495 /DNA_ORIENTATION=-
MSLTVPRYPLVLTDGECAACNHFVNFLLNWEGDKQVFAYASLQDAKAQDLLTERGIPLDLNTMVMIDSHTGKAYTKSTAVIKTLAQLGFPFMLLLVFLLVPAFIRDVFYSWFAANRIRFFGNSEYCTYLTPKLRPRFLQHNPDILLPQDDMPKTR